MKTYTFLVEEAHYYTETMTVEAESEEQAKALLTGELEENPLESRKNTFNGSDLDFTLQE